MKANVGTADKIIRIIIGIVLIVLSFVVAMSSTLQIILLVLGIVMLLTALVGFCGLYVPFGINTCKRKPE